MVVADNPIIARRYRGGVLESVHRGAWAVTDRDGKVLAGAGDPDQPIFARSSSKSLQAAPLIAAGVAERFDLTEPELALMAASHNGEPVHVAAVTAFLAKLGLDESALQCGAAAPAGHDIGPKTRTQHCCSGKHAGFLAGAVELGDDPSRYLDPESAVQRKVRAGVAGLAAMDEDDLVVAIDGCSAPTFVFPLRKLAVGIANVATPDRLAPGLAAAASRLTESVAANPEMIAGTRPARFDTALVRATGGRLFAKGGADGVQVIGVKGAGIAFCGKSDDGNDRGLVPVALAALARLGHIDEAELEAVAEWGSPTITNADGLSVGRQEIEPSSAATPAAPESPGPPAAS